MKVLLIAYAEKDDLDIGHEIALISSLHQTTVLTSRTANSKDIFAEASKSTYDILHFAGHTYTKNLDILDEVEVADGVLTLSDMSRLARIANVKLLIMNSCLAARFGFYATNHGVSAAIFTTVSVPDRMAWQIAADFYKKLALLEKSAASIETNDFKFILRSVANGEGIYGWSQSDATPITHKISDIMLLILFSIGATSLILSILTLFSP